MYLSQAVVAALLRRYRTGDGATIEVSMLEATVEWMGHALYAQMHTGSQPARMGVSHSAIAPYDKCPTSDGAILIAVQTTAAGVRSSPTCSGPRSLPTTHASPGVA